jgi:putative acetyltransferase
MPADSFALTEATEPTDDIRALIGELDAELAEGYPPEQQHGLKLDEIFAPHVRFFVAHLDGLAAGCGAVALLDGFAEIKRMYTRAATRGQGVAQAILNRLEGEARAAGVPLLRLETGDTLAAAIALYEKSGFQPRGAFGDYLSKPPHTIARSRFFEKRL